MVGTENLFGSDNGILRFKPHFQKKRFFQSPLFDFMLFYSKHARKLNPCGKNIAENKSDWNWLSTLKSLSCSIYGVVGIIVCLSPQTESSLFLSLSLSFNRHDLQKRWWCIFLMRTQHSVCMMCLCDTWLVCDDNLPAITHNCSFH